MLASKEFESLHIPTTKQNCLRSLVGEADVSLVVRSGVGQFVYKKITHAVYVVEDQSSLSSFLKRLILLIWWYWNVSLWSLLKLFLAFPWQETVDTQLEDWAKII